MSFFFRFEEIARSRVHQTEFRYINARLDRRSEKWPVLGPSWAPRLFINKIRLLDFRPSHLVAGLSLCLIEAAALGGSRWRRKVQINPPCASVTVNRFCFCYERSCVFRVCRCCESGKFLADYGRGAEKPGAKIVKTNERPIRGLNDESIDSRVSFACDFAKFAHVTCLINN